MISLVGYTGFVGSNLCLNTKFDGLYNSKNITEAYGTNPDLLVYAGVSGVKFLANKFPERDYLSIKIAYNNIKKINPKKLVLISTIDVYKDSYNKNEDDEICTDKLQPYGLNRYKLEEWTKQSFNTTIIRLPALYGKNLRKNFIYDYINIIPPILVEEKYYQIKRENDFIKNFYYKNENGLFQCKNLTMEEKSLLKNFFIKIGFSALNFTDSRGIFQYYNLENLSKDIDIILQHKIKLVNLATEPIKTDELVYYLSKKVFKNILDKDVPNYNFKTKYDKIFGGQNGYIYNKKYILENLEGFINKYKL